MGLFTPSSKPRRFRHVMIYSDEHRDLVSQIEQQARRELGMESEQPQNDPEKLRGVFTQRSSQLRQRGSHSLVLGLGLMLVAIILLLLVWFVLGLSL